MTCPRFTDLGLQKNTVMWPPQNGLCVGGIFVRWLFQDRMGRGCWWSSQGSPVAASTPSRGSSSIPPAECPACSQHGVRNGKCTQWCSCASRLRTILDVSLPRTSRSGVCVAGGVRRLIPGLLTASWSAPVSRGGSEHVSSPVRFPFSFLSPTSPFVFQDLQSLTFNKL